MDYCCKRVPSQDSELQRSVISSQLKLLVPHEPESDLISGLSLGNAKTGTSGRHYDSVFIWNMPPFVTCPGCSAWCYSHCYNADKRSNVYPIQKWCENWWIYLNRQNELKARIKLQLDQAQGRVAVRIHSSGDFFSNEYINFWIDIISEYPEVKFWAYTRSWAVDNLKGEIERLHELQNMSLYASYDATMSKTPPVFPKSYVFDNTNGLIEFTHTFGGAVCPEQFGKVSSCADCGLCMTKTHKDILFVLH